MSDNYPPPKQTANSDSSKLTDELAQALSELKLFRAEFPERIAEQKQLPELGKTLAGRTDQAIASLEKRLRKPDHVQRVGDEDIRRVWNDAVKLVRDQASQSEEQKEIAAIQNRMAEALETFQGLRALIRRLLRIHLAEDSAHKGVLEVFEGLNLSQPFLGDMDAAIEILTAVLRRPAIAFQEPTVPVSVSDAERPRARGKRGPPADMQHHQNVKEVLDRYRRDDRSADWRKPPHLAKLCKLLDREKVNPPEAWLKRRPESSSWAQAAEHYPDVVVKAIQYRLYMTSRSN